MTILKLFSVSASLLLVSAPVYAQTGAVEKYLQSAGATTFFLKDVREARTAKAKAAGDQAPRELQISYNAILPLSHNKALVDYVNTKASLAQRFPDATQLASDAVGAQFNKLLGSSASSSGTTSVTSGSAVSSVLSLAIEYGSITQTSAGNVATIRSNLFSPTRPLVGGDVFPVCTDSSKVAPCTTASRWLRKLSASYSAETSGSGSAAAATGTNAQTGAATTTNIFAGGYRTAGWGVRMDWFAANPYQVANDKFLDAMKTIGASAEMATFEASIGTLLSKPEVRELYGKWTRDTIADLESTADEMDAKRRLELDLDNLLGLVRGADKDFDTNVVKLQTSYATTICSTKRFRACKTKS